jgi:diaminopropionate ammonia-lyase
LAHRPVRFLLNPAFDRARPYGPDQLAVLDRESHARARTEIESWPGYAPTPLVSLEGLAQELGVRTVWYKDESWRLDLESFKALGGAYGVLKVLRHVLDRSWGVRDVTSEDLQAEVYREEVASVTVTCATAGNHGRSVAWGAKMLGCQAVIYIPTSTSLGRMEAITDYGAQVIPIQGSYDDAVALAKEQAERRGWFVVADTTNDAGDPTTLAIMQGYSVLAAECLEQLRGSAGIVCAEPDSPLPSEARPTHVFVQGGVGGLAGAVCGHLWETLGEARPVYVVVEPDEAACCYCSALAGAPTPADGTMETVMGCLACQEVSAPGWKILASGAEAFLTISDEATMDSMRLLAKGVGGDPAMVAGESGAAGLAGAMAALADTQASGALGLGPEARILVIGTEGATDPELYREIVG